MASSVAKPIIRSLRHRLFLPLTFLALCLAGFTSQAQTYPTGFSEIALASLQNATMMDFAPDGRIFVAIQGGDVRVIKNGALLATPFMTLSVASDGELGLLGLTFDPNFSSNSYIYAYYTVPSSPLHNRVSRFTANGDVVVPGSEVVLLDLPDLGDTRHLGGAIHFGPDGKLYIAVGDNSVPGNAQSLDSYMGKLLRLNADGSIPSDNPYTTGSAAKRSVWAWGLRNPFTFSFQPGTGRLFVDDVGQGAWEEVNDATSGGRNFGWPVYEGVGNDPAYTDPVYAYAHGSGDGVGCSIMQGTFFNPSSTNYPAQYIGKYFITDLCNKWINYLTVSGSTGVPSSFSTDSRFGATMGVYVGPDGNLYLLRRGEPGTVSKIIYSSTCPPLSVSIAATPSLTITSGGSVTLTASSGSPTGATTYTWSNGSTANPLIVSNVTSTTAFSVTAVSGVCSGTATATVSVTQPVALPIITAGTATGTSTACVGTASGNQTFTVSGSSLTASIVATAPMDFEISTSPGSGFGPTVTLTQSAGTVSTTTLYVRTTSTATAGSKTGNVSLTSSGATTQNVAVTGTVNAIPSVSASANPSTITSGQSSTLTATGANTYVWTGSSTTNPLTVNPAMTTTYSVTGTTSGCSATATTTVTVTVNAPAPVCPTYTAALTSATTATICAGTPVTISFTVPTGSTQPTRPYAFTYSDGTTTTTATATDNSGTSFVVTPTVNATYTLLTVKDAAGCPATTIGAPVSVTVNQPPTVANAGAPQSIPQGTYPQLSANTPTVGTGSWSASIPGTFGSVSSPTTSFTPTDPAASLSGSYGVTWTISNGACPPSSSSATINMVPAGTLTLNVTANPTTILTTGTTTLSATVSGGTSPVSYTFSGPGTITPGGNTATVSGLSAGVQTFTVVARDATLPTSQSTSQTVTVTVNAPAPVCPTYTAALTSATTATICAATPVTISFAVPTGSTQPTRPYAFTYSDGTTTTTATATDNSGTSFVVTPTVNTTYTLLTVKDAAGCPATTIGTPVSITLSQPPTVANAGAAQAIPQGTYPQLSANTPTVGTGSWSASIPGTFGSVSSPATSFTPTDPAASLSGSYGVTWTISNGACPPSSSSATINMVPAGTLTLNVTANPTTILTTGTTTLSATASGGTPGYTYTFNGPGTITPGGNTATVSGLSAGVQTFIVVARDATLPTSQSTSQTVTVTVNAPAPVCPTYTAALTSATTATICAATPVTISFAVPTGSTQPTRPYSFTYSDGITTTTATATDNSGTSFVVTPTVNTTYTLLAVKDAAGCPATTIGTPVSITLSQPPTVANAGAAQAIPQGTYPQLSANTPTVGTGSWSASIPGTFGSVSSPTTSFTPTDPAASLSGSYGVTWTISNGACPPSSSSTTITMVPAGTLTLNVTANPTTILTTGTTTLSATASGGTPGYTYTFNGPGTITPSGNTATVSGLSAGVQTFAVVARDATLPTNQSTSQTVTVTVNAVPVPPTTAGIPNQVSTVGTGVNLNIVPFFTSTNGALRYAATGLPTGLSLANGIISGTPSVSGVSNVTVVATDAASLSVSTAFTFTINPAPVTVTSLSLTVSANPTITTAGNVTLTASVSGGTPGYTYTFSGPGTITPTGNTATVSGLGVGTQTFTIVARDATLPVNQSIIQTITVTVNSIPVVGPLSATVLSYNCTTGDLVLGSIAGNGATVQYAIPGITGFTTNPNQNIPAGVRRDGSEITISIQQAGVSGTPFTFGFRNFCQNGGQPTPTAPTTTGIPNQVTTVGTAYSLNLAPFFTSTNGALSFVATGLPAGLALTGSTIMGTPVASGVSTVTIRATDASNLSVSTAFIFTVNPVGTTPPTPTAPTTTGIPNQVATVGTAYSLNLSSFFTSTNGALSFVATSLPTGLALTGSTIMGTPIASGVSTVTIRATDASNLSVSTAFTFTVNPASVTPPVSGPLSATVLSYNCTTGDLVLGSTGGNGVTVQYAIPGITGFTTNPNQNIPEGVRRDGSSITIMIQQGGVNGTPFTFNFRNFCQNGGQPTPTAPTTTGIPNQVATVGTAYSFNLAPFFTSTNGALSFMATGLPAGLALTGSTIMGTPVASGVSTVTIRATDASSLSVSTAFVFTVNPVGTTPPTPTAPTTTGIPNQVATVGTAYSLNLAPFFTSTNGALSFVATSLPTGLALTGNTITGTPVASGVSTVTIRATDASNLSVSTAFTFTVNPASVTPPVSGPLSATVLSYNCTTGDLVLGSIAGNGATVQYAIPGITGFTTNPNQNIPAGVRRDGSEITIFIQQAGVSGTPFTFGFRNFCQNGGQPTPTAPTTTGIPNQVATVGTAYSLNLAPFFTSTNGALSFVATSLPAGLALTGSTITGTPVASGVSTVTVRATDASSFAVSTAFTFTVNPISTTPPVTGPLSATVLSYNCTTGDLVLGSTGGNGATVQYAIPGITGFTTNPNQNIPEGVRRDGSSITIMIQQGGVNGTPFTFNFRNFCQSTARQSVLVEPVSELTISVLGNPTSGEAVVDISGAEGQALSLRLADMSGRLVETRLVPVAGAIERQRFDLSRQAPGVLLLQVSHGGELKTVKIAKQ